MKKFALTALAFCLMISIFSISSDPIHADEMSAMQHFEIMQENITSQLVPNSDFTKFHYNKEAIKDIVYSFSFEKLFVETGIELNAETFFDIAIHNIDNTVPIKEDYISSYWITGPQYGKHAVEERWNSVRTFMPKYAVKDYIGVLRHKTYQNVAIGLVIKGAAKLKVFGAQGDLVVSTLGSLVILVAGWNEGLANHLADFNERTNYGVVLDTNKFTAYYKMWTQPSHTK